MVRLLIVSFQISPQSVSRKQSTPCVAPGLTDLSCPLLPASIPMPLSQLQASGPSVGPSAICGPPELSLGPSATCRPPQPSAVPPLSHLWAPQPSVGLSAICGPLSHLWVPQPSLGPMSHLWAPELSVATIGVCGPPEPTVCHSL